MKYVSLLRHAKAAPADHSGDDFSRPLTEAGRSAATRVGDGTRDEIPDLVLCSPARRTRETLDLVCQAWMREPIIQFETPLYLAEWDSLLARLRAVQADVTSVWLVGHNPGLHELAIEFGRYSGMRVSDSEIGRHFPTASRASFSFDIENWSALPSHHCRLSAFVSQR